MKVVSIAVTVLVLTLCTVHKAQACSLLVDILVGCDVVQQDLMIQEQKTSQAAIEATANEQVARADQAAIEAQAEADMWAAKYAADASVEIAEANERAQHKVAGAYAYADRVRAEVAGTTKVKVAQIEASSAFELGVIPYVGAAVLLLIIYLIYFRHTEVKMKMAQYNVLPDRYAGLVPWQRQVAKKADERGIQWVVTRRGFEFNHPVNGWQVFETPKMIGGGNGKLTQR